METNDGRYGHFFKGLLVGGFLGGLAGLLFAPKSGKELRGDIRETREKTFGEAKEILGKTSQQISETRQRAKRILSFIKKEKGESAPRYAEPVEEFVGEA
jgi:gas vesicle protein